MIDSFFLFFFLTGELSKDGLSSSNYNDDPLLVADSKDSSHSSYRNGSNSSSSSSSSTGVSVGVVGSNLDSKNAPSSTAVTTTSTTGATASVIEDHSKEYLQRIKSDHKHAIDSLKNILGEMVVMVLIAMLMIMMI